jgi:two-component system cell cycle sensor histidine kinase/response regulator CckA
LREAEDRLREAARLETVGRLVAGVAHDFSNLLTVIVGSADAIRSRLPDGDPLREAADTIAETAHTAASVTRQLLGFARPTDPAPCPLDANVAIQGLHRTLRRLVGERVTVDVLPAARLPLILADPGQFDRVLLNLVVNARDAIAGVGTVTVRTAAAQVPPGRPGWPADLPPGEFVAVTVSDTGVGMTQEVLGRIFDPFFTTKGERGTGLGLATVRELVRAAGGHVEVESSPGWGTSVRVFWPALRDEPTDRPRLVR